VASSNGAASVSAESKKEQRRKDGAKSLAWGLALGLVGALGALPVANGEADSVALLAWIAWIALPAGVLFGARGADLLRFGLVAPGCWMVALALVDAQTEVPSAALPTPVWAAVAWSGMFYAGAALGRWIASRRPSAVFTASGAALFFTAALAGLPSRGGFPGEPWPPRVASALLDVSPVVFLWESAGLRDAQWHKSLYASAGIDRFARAPWEGKLAGPAVLLVGCALALGASRATRRSTR
jgi:hypothetical protein